MKLVAAFLLALAAFATATTLQTQKLDADVPSFRLNMIKHIVEKHNGTVADVGTIPCDICQYALKEAYSFGCGKAGGIIADLCLDFAPLCYAALEMLCKICETSCDVDNIILQVCTDVHLC